MTEPDLGTVTKEVEVISARNGAKTREKRTDRVAVEEPVHIFVNGERYATILCTPSNKEALVIGNMVSEGLIGGLDEIREVQRGKGGTYQVCLRGDVDVLKRLDLSSSFKRLILSSCGSYSDWPLSKIIDRIKIPKVEDSTRFNPRTISDGVRNLNFLATTFRKTGGVHAAALYTSRGDLIAFAEDIGRHNAVDKVIGLSIQKDKSFNGTMIASTGRLTGDIVLKASRMKIPLVASLAAAVDSGVEVAAKTGLTLVGFVRGDRMTIYTSPERVS